MGIPPSAMDTTAFGRLNKESEKTLDFMSSAAEGKFVHSIQMPWTVIEHNADSIQGKTLTWSPPVVKFMLKPYTMTAVSRQINYWAVILSATVVFLTILAFIRTKKKAVR